MISVYLKKFKKLKPIDFSTGPKSLDLFWTAMSGMIYQFALFPFILVIGALFLKLDPLLRILEMMPPLTTPCYLAFYSITVYVIVATHFEGCRLYPLPVIVSFSLCKMLTGLILPLHLRRNRYRLPVMVTQYLKLSIILEQCLRFSEFLIAVLMLIAMCATVLFAFVTIRMYDHFPVWFYSFFPSVNVFVAVFGNFGLGLGIGVRNESERVLRIWRGWLNEVLAGRERGIMRRRLRSLRAMGFGGRFIYLSMYKLEKGIRIKYLDKVVIYTINLLLGVPKFD